MGNVISHMMGNIGNQLFIYAMARATQLQYKKELTIDLSGLKRSYYTAAYKLNRFQIPSDINYDMKRIPTMLRWKWQASNYVFRVAQVILRGIRRDRLQPRWFGGFWFKFGCIYNTSHDYIEYPRSDKDNLLLYGYFQCDKYFNNFKDVISSEIKLKELSENDKLYIQKMTTENSVAISIRANKTPENPKVEDNLGLGMIKQDFYYRGMEEIAKKVNNPVFYVFSDSLDIVKREYEFPYPVTYVTPDDSASGIQLMRSCKHAIITNSTFSWWGAYLIDNPDKIVVMPDVWDRFGPMRKDIYFENPIKLSVEFFTK